MGFNSAIREIIAPLLYAHSLVAIAIFAAIAAIVFGILP
jgi:hypothetical protein